MIDLLLSVRLDVDVTVGGVVDDDLDVSSKVFFEKDDRNLFVEGPKFLLF